MHNETDEERRWNYKEQEIHEEYKKKEGILNKQLRDKNEELNAEINSLKGELALTGCRSLVKTYISKLKKEGGPIEIFDLDQGEIIPFKRKTFPCLEQHIEIQDIDPNSRAASISWNYENPSEMLDIIFINDYLRENGFSYVALKMHYVPFSRQDRHFKNECFTLKSFCNLVNNCKFNRVVINDPHSDVTPALLNNCYVNDEHDALALALKSLVVGGLFNKVKFVSKFHFLSPDAGALKKVNKLAMQHNPESVIQCTKHRDIKTGDITGTEVFNIPKDDYPIIIIDDICEGGRTFIEIAKILKKDNPERSVILCVTHGFFSAGLDVFDGLIDGIFTREGEIKNDK